MLESLINTYGYLTIFIGTFLEGETVLVLGGFAAFRGYLSLPCVILTAFLGSLLGDQLFFYLGRKHSQGLLEKRPHWKPRVERAQRIIRRFQTPIILGFRFLYGLRTIAPFAIGMSRVTYGKFIVMNTAGAFIWAVAVGGGGYLFGQAMHALLGHIKKYEMTAFAGIAIVGLGLWIYHLIRAKKKKKMLKQARMDENPS
jgi:membrane protein DedA with SNARE-associated domain